MSVPSAGGLLAYLAQVPDPRGRRSLWPAELDDDVILCPPC